MAISSRLPNGFLLLLLIATTCSINAVVSCQFGPGCLHECNCVVSCDAHTGCSGQCAEGWDGPTCQRQNVALKQNTTQSTTYSAAYESQHAVDGKTGHSAIHTPCTHTLLGTATHPSTWSVTLNRVYTIIRFQIYNRDESCGTDGPCGRRLAGFTLSVGNSCSPSYGICYMDKTAPNQTPGKIIDGLCNEGGPVSGNIVQITARAGQPLTLCEVLIYVCSNGSYGQNCGQSCGFCAQGRHFCDKISGNCPNTSRQDQPRCEAGYSGQKCKAECNDSNWGADCKQTCGHCYNDTACNKTSGECPAGNPQCSAGYSGTMCETKCNDSNWGVDCQQKCGHCYNDTACNKTLGECPAGNPRCSAGYSGTMCETKCKDSNWGFDCQQTCGHCYNGTTCNKTSGECPAGNPRCLAGYTGKMCQTKSMASQAPSSVSGIVIGGVIGAFVCGAVIVAAIIMYRRRRHQTAKPNGPARHVPEPSTEIAASIREPNQNVEVELDDVGIEVAEDDNTDPYENFAESPTFVSIDELPDYVKRKKTCGGFKKEFEKLPAGLQAKYEVADKEPNKAKSRYKNLVAYDHSRVVLRMLPDDEHSDYINACHINGYKEPKKFIAAQGPNEVIIDDFVRMIWEQNTGKVVMLTNLVEGIKIKCDQYWPTTGSKRFGLIEVTLSDEEVFANYTIRTLQITHAKVKNKVKTVQQFHFTTWPDHRAPSYASGLLDFWHKVLHQQTDLNGPILVHCSAGVGRTGTFIALDYLINQAKAENYVDVAACVRELRQQRVNMVQTQVQYEFLHEALVAGIQLSDCYVSSVNFASVYNELMTTTNPETEQTKLAEQFKVLYELTPALGESDFTAARHPDNIIKNRSDMVLASDSSRPFLSTPVTACNNYINAVFLPSFRLRRGFILTQTPLQNTVVDFWRLVYELNVSTVVMLDRVAEHDKNVGIYWPEQTGTFDQFVVETITIDESDDFYVSTYKLTYKDTEAQHQVQQIRCKFWPGKPSANSLSSLLLVMQNAETYQQTSENGPIIVHCRDGVTKSGMYCVASSIIERLKIEHEVNILQTVAEMRTSRPEIITNLEQYQCLYQMVKGYLDNFQTYANFS